jgi:hypothetical protein
MPSLQHKRIAMGLSYVAGWGAFLREDARKHELIGEYTGELVDQEEAERRCAFRCRKPGILAVKTGFMLDPTAKSRRPEPCAADVPPSWHHVDFVRDCEADARPDIVRCRQVHGITLLRISSR